MEKRFGVTTVSEKVRTIVFTSGLLTESIVTRSPVTNPWGIGVIIYVGLREGNASH